MNEQDIILDVDVHVGETLDDASNSYPTLMKAVLEAVQNGIDNDAMHITVLVDQHKRRGNVCDDGDGAGIEDVQRALKSVNKTLKDGEENESKTGRLRIGRYGKGFFAFLTKCRYFEFISSPKGADQYMSFRFEREKIVREQSVQIKGVPLSKFAYGRTKKPGKTMVDWATQVAFTDQLMDRMVNDITSADQIVREVFKKFGRIMNTWDIRLSVVYVKADGTREERLYVEAPKFSGTPLSKELDIRTAGGSRATFEMYLARKDEHGKPVGEVLMGDMQDPSTFTFQQFVHSIAAHKGLLSAEVCDGLLSGYFEGEIRAEKARMHSDRDKYVITEAVAHLCATITQWYEEVGRQHVERINSAHSNERRQRLAQTALRNADLLLRKPEFAPLNEAMQKLKEGTIGRGHTEPEPETVIGKQEEPSVSISGGLGDLKDLLQKREKVGASSRATKPKPKPQTPIEGHHPKTVVGPAGEKRTRVKESSRGLQIVHDDMEGRDELWLLDERQGILYFNIRHPVWVMCDDDGKTKISDMRVVRLQEIVIIFALQWLSLSIEQRPLQRRIMDDSIAAIAYLLQYSPSFK